MAGNSKIEKARSSEANVLIEFQMIDPMSEEVLDANSDDVLHKKIAEIISVILRDTDLELHVSRSEVESQDCDEAQTGEFATA